MAKFKLTGDPTMDTIIKYALIGSALASAPLTVIGLYSAYKLGPALLKSAGKAASSRSAINTYKKAGKGLFKGTGKALKLTGKFAGKALLATMSLTYMAGKGIKDYISNKHAIRQNSLKNAEKINLNPTIENDKMSTFDDSIYDNMDVFDIIEKHKDTHDFEQENVTEQIVNATEVEQDIDLDEIPEVVNENTNSTETVVQNLENESNTSDTNGDTDNNTNSSNESNISIEENFDYDINDTNGVMHFPKDESESEVEEPEVEEPEVEQPQNTYKFGNFNIQNGHRVIDVLKVDDNTEYIFTRDKYGIMHQQLVMDGMQLNTQMSSNAEYNTMKKEAEEILKAKQEEIDFYKQHNDDLEF